LISLVTSIRGTQPYLRGHGESSVLGKESQVLQIVLLDALVHIVDLEQAHKTEEKTDGADRRSRQQKQTSDDGEG
jgi:hypothetical protein